MGGKPWASARLDAAGVRVIARALAAASSDVDASAFVTAATAGLDAMTGDARVRHVVACLDDALPEPFVAAIAVILEAVHSERSLRGALARPLVDYVGEHGLGDRDIALDALMQLTRRSSAAPALRPFHQHHPDHTLALMRAWAGSGDEHVRLLVVEGSRPRLPSALPLRRFIANPEPVLDLLSRLRHDASARVRAAVAAAVDDIARDHPARVTEWRSITDATGE